MQRQFDLPGTAPPHGLVDPFADHQARMSPTPTIRRLCTVKFLCHLCQGTHGMDHYITLPAESIEEYARNVVQTMSEQDNALKLLQSSAQSWHSLNNDLQERLAEMEGNEEPRTAGILELTIRQEENYACDAYHAEFANVGMRRLHLGRNPVTNLPTGASQCPAPQGEKKKASTEE